MEQHDINSLEQPLFSNSSIHCIYINHFYLIGVLPHAHQANILSTPTTKILSLHS